MLVRRNEDGKDICQRYRPQRMSEVVGLRAVKQSLVKAMALGESRSKTYLFQGDRGCGKTTLARILAMGLNCEHGDTAEPCLECETCKAALAGHAWHITEINMAQLNKKEDAEDIVRNMHYASLTGRNNVYIFDEAQMLTVAAQNLLLKNLEDPPAHTYIIICTTDQSKLIKTLVDRCEKYRFSMPSEADIKNILNDVYKQEHWKLPDDLEPAKFVEAMLGRSFREILKTIDQAMRGGMGAIDLPFNFENPESIDLCRKIVSGDFVGAVNLIAAMKKSEEVVDWEGLRLMIAGYLKAIIYKDPKRTDIVRALEHFSRPIQESRYAEINTLLEVSAACSGLAEHFDKALK